MNEHFYFDNSATTPIAKEALIAMVDAYTKEIGNSSSPHRKGQIAKGMLSLSRNKIASFFGVPSDTLFFSSSATEALNLLIQGFQPKTILSTRTEHASIHEQLIHHSHILYAPVDSTGSPSIASIEELAPQASIMVFSLVNSETGVILPYQEIAAIACTYNIPLIIDATAALGKIPINILPGTTALVVSSHKIHGPYGVGAFYLKRLAKLIPIIRGGGQEKGLRSGTENIPAIQGFAAAIELISQNDFLHMEFLRNRFESIICSEFPQVEINGSSKRAPHISSLYFPDVDIEAFQIALDLDGIYASFGSACSSGARKPSRILEEMGFGRARSMNSLRFSFSRYLSVETVEEGAKKICAHYKQLTQNMVLI